MNDRVVAFVRGQLEGRELEDFERELDRDPELRRAVASLASTASGLTLPSTEPAHQPSVVEGGVELQRVIGQGGLARVRLGRQRDLQREVAVKVVRHIGDVQLTERLLQEARLTGALEHPGIVPVHFVEGSTTSELRVVLKRVEGVTWASLIDDEDRVRARFDQDLLDWNLSMLIRICSALSFAHEHRVLHRDVKPSNVMIGRHGEVYLMDWGVAGLLEPDPSGLLPAVRDTPGAGTPSYMAPEQVTASAAALSPATDVFLLGAVLYEILWGAPPFKGDLASRRPDELPDFSTIAREDLAAVARQAMALDPAARFADVDAFRRAVEACIRSADAERLLRRSVTLLETARTLRAAANPLGAASAALEAAFVVRSVRALEHAPKTAAAVELDVARFRVDCALADAKPELAAEVLAFHGVSLPDLHERVRAALAEAAHVARLAKDADPRAGASGRVSFMGALLGLSALFYVVRFALRDAFTSGWVPFWSSTIYLGGVFALTRLFRATLEESRLNRPMAQLVMAITAGQMMSRAITATLSLPPRVNALFEFGVVFTALVAGAALHWTFGVGATVVALGLTLALSLPERSDVVFMVTVLVAIVSMTLTWRLRGVWGSRE